MTQGNHWATIEISYKVYMGKTITLILQEWTMKPVQNKIFRYDDVIKLKHFERPMTRSFDVFFDLRLK